MSSGVHELRGFSFSLKLPGELGPDLASVLGTEVEAGELAAALFLHRDAVRDWNPRAPAIDARLREAESLGEPDLEAAAVEQRLPVLLHDPVSMRLVDLCGQVQPDFQRGKGLGKPHTGEMTESTKSFGFGERLRAARLARDITGEELGRGVGPDGKDASKASVSDWERERHYPKADQLRIICMKLGISSDELLFGQVVADKQVMQAASVVQSLTEDQRRQLFREMMGPAASDRVVEQRMPITRAPPSSPAYKKVNTEPPLVHKAAADKKRASKRRS